MRILVVLLLSLPALGETVRFKTADGIQIVADYFKGKPDAGGVICIPMYRSNRATYRPLVLPLTGKGFHVLLIDTRGHGESAPDLAPRVKSGDAALFNAMHKDVEAGIAFLEGRGCDVTRIGLVGASVGCSVAVDATVRNPHAVRAVVLLTPGSKYLGVDTLEQLKHWPGTRIFTFTSSEEHKTSEQVMETLRPFDGSNHMVVPGTGIHGTNMFGKVTALEGLIANFMESSMVKSADLRVPVWAADSKEPASPGFFRKTLRPRRTVDGITYSLMAYGLGETLHVGALVAGEFKGKVRFRFEGDESVLLPFDTGSPSGRVETGGVVSHQAAAGEFHWIAIERAGFGKAVRVSLEFLPSKGKRTKLPAKGVFAAVPQPIK